MNVSMQDAFNLGWKLASVLREQCAPHLLHTYSAERQAVAQGADRFRSRMGRAVQRSAKGETATSQASTRPRPRATSSGTAAIPRAPRPSYRPSIITAEPTYQHLAKGLVIGMRFHSAPVIRLADAKPVHLGHAVKADGRWRVFAFAGADDPAARRLRHSGAVRFSGAGPKVSGQEVHAGGRRHRLA